MDHNRALQTVKIFKHWWSGIFTGQSNACRTLSKHWRQEIFVGKRNQHTIRYFSDTRGEHQAGQRMPLLCYAHMYAHMHKQTTPKQCLQSDLQDGNQTHLMAIIQGNLCCLASPVQCIVTLDYYVLYKYSYLPTYLRTGRFLLVQSLTAFMTLLI